MGFATADTAPVRYSAVGQCRATWRESADFAGRAWAWPAQAADVAAVEREIRLGIERTACSATMGSEGFPIATAAVWRDMPHSQAGASISLRRCGSGNGSAREYA